MSEIIKALEQAEDVIRQRDAEIERLRRRYDDYLIAHETATNWLDDGCPYCEIAKLRDENELLRDGNGCAILDMKDEIARLCAALHWIAQNGLDGACVRKAMAALEQAEDDRNHKSI